MFLNNSKILNTQQPLNLIMFYIEILFRKQQVRAEKKGYLYTYSIC